jgi:hypothetical protein
MKFNMAASSLRSLVHEHCMKHFQIEKETLENKKKLNIKNSQMDIPLNNNLVHVIKLNRVSEILFILNRKCI